MIKLIVIFFISWITVHAHSANFTTEKSAVHPSIYITGTINSGDAMIFQNKVNELKKDYDAFWWKKSKDHKFSPSVVLISKGGNLTESMKIGYIVRENESTTIVPFNTECLSSCVFILAAGVQRNVFGNVGIHRPYFEALNPNATTSEIKKMRDENKKLMKDYFYNMDVSESIIDEMLSIEPNNIKILNGEELTKFRLSVMDANHEEKMIAEQAQRYNLTSSIYRQRDAIREKKCGGIVEADRRNRLSDFFKCQIMTMLNISESEATLRLSKALEKCSSLEAGIILPCYDATLRGN